MDAVDLLVGVKIQSGSLRIYLHNVVQPLVYGQTWGAWLLTCLNLKTKESGTPQNFLTSCSEVEPNKKTLFSLLVCIHSRISLSQFGAHFVALHAPGFCTII